MNKEKKTQWILYGVLAVLLGGCLLFLLRPSASVGGLVAVVQVDSRVVRELALDTAPDQTFSIEQQSGHPIIFEVRDHAIRFQSSDCPDKVCVNTGFLSRDLDVASCLPNRTVLVVEQR